MPTVTVDVDVDVWEVIGEADDEDLIQEMKDRGYSVSKEPEALSVLDREDLNFLLSVVSDVSLEGRRVYDKLKDLRYGYK